MLHTHSARLLISPMELVVDSVVKFSVEFISSLLFFSPTDSNLEFCRSKIKIKIIKANQY